MTDDELRAWAYLASVAEPPCAPLGGLIARVGVLEAASAVRRRTMPHGFGAVLGATEARYRIDSAATDLDLAHRIGARLVTPEHEEWPAWSLLPLGRADTAARGGEPLALWARGPGRIDETASSSIALVGARASTAYGDNVTATMSAGLVDKGWAVTSGAAFGIDVAAHRGALAAGGTTMAVLACGIDRDYPTAHSVILGEIARTGLVITEYPPGSTVARRRFLTRNRLVAALSEAVIVVEAGIRSGAASTAAWARKLDRPVGAVPGPVTSAMSVGCHRLIADDQATLVTDADSVITLVRPDGGADPGRGRDSAIDLLTDEQKRVHDAIPGRGSVTVADVSFVSGLEIPIVRRALAVLEVGGHIVGDGNGFRLP